MYDIPYMFEAREFLRKKLIGKKVGFIIEVLNTSKAQCSLQMHLSTKHIRIQDEVAHH